MVAVVGEENNMSAVLKYEVQLESQTCGECGITFAAPSGFWRERRNSGEGWYCPNGHSRVYRETDVEKLRKEMQAKLDAKERELQWAQRGREEYRKKAEASKRKLTATKGALTKTKKRIANGVCPCCNRQFANLHRHMTTKHPDFAGKASD